MQVIKPSWTKLKETLKNSYTSYIPNQLFTDDRLHSSSIKVFGIINALCFASKNDCYPSQSLIAYLANTCLKTVSRAVKELEQLGYIKIKRSKGFVNTYTVVAKFCKNIINSIKNKAKEVKQVTKAKSKNKKDTFNNYSSQRKYDFDSLEKKLLGWEVATDLDGITEYLQQTIQV